MSEATLTQADVDAAIAEAKKGLEAKRDELLTEVKNLKAELRKTQDINPADLQAAEERAEKAEAALKEAQGQVKALTTERDKAVKALESETGFTQKLLIQDGLKSALLANGVKDEDFIDALSTKFAGSASIVVEGDVRKAMIGDKAVGDYVKEWAASDAGKKFVSAPDNSGGGATGGKGGGQGGKTMARAQFDALDQGGRASFIKDGGKVVEAA